MYLNLLVDSFKNALKLKKNYFKNFYIILKSCYFLLAKIKSNSQLTNVLAIYKTVTANKLHNYVYLIN